MNQAFNLPSKNKSRGLVPWDYSIEDENYQIEPWILKKGKEYITNDKEKENKGFFLLQKDEEKRQSINGIQIKLKYHKLIVFVISYESQRLNLKIKAQKND